jgi:Cu-Zn family superoxide dismutase
MKRVKKILWCIAGLLFIWYFLRTGSNEINESETASAIAIIEEKHESGALGEVLFIQTENYVRMEAMVKGLPLGVYTIHIHEKGDCSAADASSAGGHWNPTNSLHGEWGKEPFHTGDVGNLEIMEDSTMVFFRTTDLWCISCGEKVKDIVGKSIVIHQGYDDFTISSDNNLNKRVGCGEIIEEPI